jgi:hypothetical protein
MKLSVANCPTCQKPAVGTVELIPGTAYFTDPDPEDGEVDFAGETKVDWGGQETRTGPNQLPLVTCGGHDWESAIEGRE